MIPAPATLGILGGGQLGRYFVTAAHELGYRVMVLDPDPRSIAGRIADAHLVAAYDDPAALQQLAQSCAAVTTEFENVPADALEQLARSVPVCPSADAVRICQNRSAEKAFLQRHGLPLAPYADIVSEADLMATPDALFPGILKVARFGYDGKGQARVSNREEALAAFHQFKATPCVLEKMLPLDDELSVVLARGSDGQTLCFPAAQNRHSNGILDISSVPARQVAAELSAQARQLAEALAEHMGYVGTMAVEFFVVAGALYVNEMAPRPHNSGHYTLDACVTSQFEQQVRALCGLPLGDARAHSSSVMINLLGDLWFQAHPQRAQEPDWSQLLSLPNIKLHLYGKDIPAPGRKMGHFTVMGPDAEQVHERAMAARARIGIRDAS